MDIYSTLIERPGQQPPCFYKDVILFSRTEPNPNALRKVTTIWLNRSRNLYENQNNKTVYLWGNDWTTHFIKHCKSFSWMSFWVVRVPETVEFVYKTVPERTVSSRFGSSGFSSPDKLHSLHSVSRDSASERVNAPWYHLKHTDGSLLGFYNTSVSVADINTCQVSRYSTLLKTERDYIQFIYNITQPCILKENQI